MNNDKLKYTESSSTQPETIKKAIFYLSARDSKNSYNYVILKLINAANCMYAL